MRPLVAAFSLPNGCPEKFREAGYTLRLLLHRTAPRAGSQSRKCWGVDGLAGKHDTTPWDLRSPNSQFVGDMGCKNSQL